MKNKCIRRVFYLLIIAALLGLYFFLITYDNKSTNRIFTDTTSKILSTKTKIDVKSEIEKYNNPDIVGYIYIPNVLSSPILKSTTNEYYLSHDNYGNYDKKGSITMDYRVNIGDKKILLYGHSGKEQDLPFLILNKYTDESFFKMNNIIYIYDSNNTKYTYKIFSSYIETEDFDYVNIKSFNGLSWKEHLNKLKNKSLFNVNTELTDDSKIIILQTCSMVNKGNKKYQLVIGVLTNVE